jgi:HTH-type transcriptional regulator/antitoxin HigA
MLRVIKTEQEYELALDKAYLLMQQDIELNTEQADELDLLTYL